MKIKLSGSVEHKISNDDFNRIKHNLDLFDMYTEYINECNKIRVKIKDINDKLDMYESELMDFKDQKNRIVSENDYTKLCSDLDNNLEEGYKNREEFKELLDKFDEIDNTKDTKLKNKMIKELDIKDGYRKYKNSIIKANELNNNYIDNLLNKKNEIEEMYNIGDEESIKANVEVINKFNRRIGELNANIRRNKESIKKNNKEIDGLIKELNKFLQLNNYADLHIYRHYLQKIKFIIKKY